MKYPLLKSILAAIILAIFLAGLCPQPSYNFTNLAFNAKDQSLLAQKKKDDDPWDPGDERPAAPLYGSAGEVMKGRGHSDDPWDPGDESGHGSGVPHA